MGRASTSRINWSSVALLTAGVAYTCQQQYSLTSDIQEVRACASSDLVEGIMKKVQIGTNPQNYIIVTSVQGKVYAFGGRCTHFGFPLSAGHIDGFTVICPFHGAQFDIRTGYNTASPGLQSLSSYQTIERDGEIFVKIPEGKVNDVASYVEQPMAKRDPTNTTKFVIIGGGAAGQACAETLRQEGFTGQILVLSKDKLLPYDRTILTKNIKADPPNYLLRNQDFYQEYGVDFKLDVEVLTVDPQKKEVKLNDGSIETYDKVLMATGSTARVFPFYKPYIGMPNVFTIRNSEDFLKAQSVLTTAEKVVIIGGSFIGLEMAAALKKAYPDKKITIIEMLEKPLEHIFGADIAGQLIDIQRMKGVEVLAGKAVKGIKAQDGKVTGVSIPGSKTFLGNEKEDLIEADALVIATGAAIQTAYAPASILNTDGSIRVNSYMQTSLPDIFAAGDIAKFLSMITENNERIEHWGVAQQQGRYAAYSMMGKGKAYMDAPYFWSLQFGPVAFAGFSNGHDWYFTEVLKEDTADKASRITYFYKEGRCIGAAATNAFPQLMKIKSALEKGLMPSMHEMANGTVRSEGIAQRVRDSSSPMKKPCCQSNKSS